MQGMQCINIEHQNYKIQTRLSPNVFISLTFHRIFSSFKGFMSMHVQINCVCYSLVLGLKQ